MRLHAQQPYFIQIAQYLEQACAQGLLDIADRDLAIRQLFAMINDIVFWPKLWDCNIVLDQEETDRVVVEAVETFVTRYAKR